MALIAAALVGTLAAQANSPTPYLAASSKKERCAALSSWYTRTLEVAGANAFSPHVHTDRLVKTTARGFVDDVFVAAIGAPYNDLSQSQRKKIYGDIGSCDMAPVENVMREYLQSAFSDDTRFSMVRDWRAAIPAAQQRAAASPQRDTAPASPVVTDTSIVERAAARVAPTIETKYFNYRPTVIRGPLASMRHGKLLQQLADHDFLGIYLDPANYPDLDTASSAYTSALDLISLFAQGLNKLDPVGRDAIPPRRGFPYAVEAFSEACQASFGPNPASYTPVWREKVGEDINYGLYNKRITEYWETKVGQTIYMEPAYRAPYANSIATEKSIIVRDIFKARDELGIEQLFMGEAQIRPLLVVKEYQDAAAAFMRINGCDAGKRLLRNWAEFIGNAQPRVRPNGDYPTIVEYKRDPNNGPDQIGVLFSDVPATEAPFYPYTEGTWLYVQYYGNRQGGLDGYNASHFNLLFVPGRVQQALLRDDALLDSFRNDRIRILNCFYDEGTVNYWLEGFPQPTERQRQAVGYSFRGSAARCPTRWPGPAPG